MSYFIRICILPLLLLSLSGCETLEDRTFGDTVPIDLDDPTPPSVELIVPNDYLLSVYDNSGYAPTIVDLSVTDEARFARAGNLANPSSTRSAHQLAYSIVARDPDGVRAVIASAIEITPWCMTDEEVPQSPVKGTLFTIEGARTERSRLASSATTRLPLRHQFFLEIEPMSELCPENHPVLIGMVAKLTGAALNFNTGPLVETAPVFIEFANVGASGRGGPWTDGRIPIGCVPIPADPNPRDCPEDY